MLSFEYVFKTIEKLIPAKEAPFKNAYQCLIFCIISLRTKDEVSYSRSKALFERAPDALSISKLTSDEIAALIYPAGFFRRKAEEILNLSKDLAAKGRQDPPDTLDGLLKIKGVGLKTANLVLSRGFNIPAICVDVHVHRIANRLGWICTDNADASEAALRRVMPKEWWIESNDLLVRFGQNICRPLRPRCCICPFCAECPSSTVT
jgi:endonuclease-3